jgi:hypothetical protein
MKRMNALAYNKIRKNGEMEREKGGKGMNI